MSWGSFPLRPARLRDLAPTMPCLYSSMPTTQRPLHWGTSILRPAGQQRDKPGTECSGYFTADRQFVLALLWLGPLTSTRSP
jgi:hypothetical protein